MSAKRLGSQKPQLAHTWLDHGHHTNYSDRDHGSDSLSQVGGHEYPGDHGRLGDDDHEDHHRHDRQSDDNSGNNGSNKASV